MTKTTIYLPSSLKAAIRRAAEAAGSSEAEVIRAALEAHAAAAGSPAPRLPLFRSRRPHLAGDVDGALQGFGER